MKNISSLGIFFRSFYFVRSHTAKLVLEETNRYSPGGAGLNAAHAVWLQGSSSASG
jgi:hypothetical protein